MIASLCHQGHRVLAKVRKCKQQLSAWLFLHSKYKDLETQSSTCCLFLLEYTFSSEQAGCLGTFALFYCGTFFLDTSILLLVLLFNILHYLKLYSFLGLTVYLALHDTRRKRHSVCLGCHPSALFGGAERKLCWVGRCTYRFQEEAEKTSLFWVSLSNIFTRVRFEHHRGLGEKLSFPSLQCRENHQKCGLYMQMACVQIHNFAHIFFFLFLMKVYVLELTGTFSQELVLHISVFHIQWSCW